MIEAERNRVDAGDHLALAVEAYRQMIDLLGDTDSTTRRMLEDILADEEEHADELKDWLVR